MGLGAGVNPTSQAPLRFLGWQGTGTALPAHRLSFDLTQGARIPGRLPHQFMPFFQTSALSLSGAFSCEGVLWGSWLFLTLFCLSSVPQCGA